MLEPSDRVLKFLSLGLGAILLVQLIRVAGRSRPLAHLTIPAVPEFVDTNASVALPASNSPALAHSAKRDTQSVSNTTTSKGATNVPQVRGTNVQPALAATKATNSSARAEAAASVIKETNAVLTPQLTNAAVAKTQPTKTGTNAPASSATKGATNAALASNSHAQPTHAAPIKTAGPTQRPNSPGTPGLRAPGPELAPAIKARVSRIVESEMFAPVVRPLPMALLGIAGDVAFLRTPNGQTGLVKEKDELGGVKLLRIGTNRVLVEENGQQKELTIFSGYGGDSLLPKEKDHPQ